MILMKGHNFGNIYDTLLIMKGGREERRRVAEHGIEGGREGGHGEMAGRK